jgi:acyl-CoA reductase-like NAD-dependent aldehyde dehydrogenase
MVAVDADLDQVADLIVGKAFENAGQIGFASPWVLAAPAVYPALVDQLQQRISTLPCGDPLDAETRVGPLIDEARAGQVMALIARAEEQGARCLCGGERDRGLVRPTLLGDVAPGQGAFGCNEVLGPVIGVSRIASLEDAPRFLNSADQLVVSIFSQDLERTMRLARQLQVTNVHVNGIPSWRDGLLDQSRSSYRVGRHTVRDRALNMTTFQDVVHHA